MARRIEYTGPPVLTLEDLAAHFRRNAADLDGEKVAEIIIPTVTAQCEAATGAAIREAVYEEEWPAGRVMGALDVGQAKEVLEVRRMDAADGILPLDLFRLDIGQRVSHLNLLPGAPRAPLRIRYKAAVDLGAYPSVKTWMLLHAGTLYQQRESLITGTIVAELPSKFTGFMLADIELPPRF